MLNAGQGGRAGGWRGMRLGGLPRAQAVFVPQELTTVRVQDPRVQNEGSWNSYVDYKIFLHVSCGCWKGGETSELTCPVAPRSRCLCLCSSLFFVQTNSKAFTAKTSCVRRRYREFVWLRRQLQKNAGLV